jgi:mannosyltransferase
MNEATKNAKSLVSSITGRGLYLHSNLVLVAGIIPLAVLLALLFLGDKSLWLDEAISVAIALADRSTMWQVISQGEANMGLYYLLLSGWLHLGQNEFVVRSLSVLFAVLTVPTVFAVGSRLFNKQVGLMAALVLAVIPFFVEYSQEARSYSLVLLLSSLSSYLFVQIVRRPSKLILAAYAVTGALAVYAHVFSAFVLAAQAISLPFLHRSAIPWKGLLVSWAAMVVLIIPLAVSILSSSAHNIDWALRPGIRDLYGLFPTFTFGKLLLLAFLIPCLAAFTYAVRHWLKSRTGTKTWHYAFLLSWLFAPIVLAFGISQIKPMFAPHYLIICLPPLALIAAAGIWRMPRRWMSIACLVLLLALSVRQVYYWYTYYEKEDWRGVSSYVLSRAKEGDAVIFYSPDISTGFDYYKGRLSWSAPYPTSVPYFDPVEYPVSNPILNVPVGYAQGGRLPDPDPNLATRLAGYDRVWLILSHDQLMNFELNRQVQSIEMQYALQMKYGMPEYKKFRQIRVFLFTYKEPPVQQ